MSRTKDGIGYVVSGGRGAWRNVSSRVRCPICGHDSWCSIRSDGALVACRRDSHGIARTDRSGVDYWIHALDSQTSASNSFDAGPEAQTFTERVDDETLDSAHRILLAELTLAATHRTALEARGLPPDEIRTREYRSLPLEGRSALARKLVDRLGETAARGVPGVYVREDGGRTWWTFGGSPGLLIPVRDIAGRIVALKVRRDEAGDGPRYTYVSGATHGGARAALAVHVPLLPAAVSRDIVRVTEGELKADVAFVLSELPTVSLPGVGSWRAAVPALQALAATGVILSFDVDHSAKPEVGEALAFLVHDCDRAGLRVAIERWDVRCGKGIDDVLCAGHAGRLRFVCGASAIAYADSLLDRAARVRGGRRETRAAS